MTLSNEFFYEQMMILRLETIWLRHLSQKGVDTGAEPLCLALGPGFNPYNMTLYKIPSLAYIYMYIMHFNIYCIYIHNVYYI